MTTATKITLFAFIALVAMAFMLIGLVLDDVHKSEPLTPLRYSYECDFIDGTERCFVFDTATGLVKGAVEMEGDN